MKINSTPPIEQTPLVPPGGYILSVRVEVDDLGVVKFGGIGLGPSIIAEAGGVLIETGEREA